MKSEKSNFSLRFKAAQAFKEYWWEVYFVSFSRMFIFSVDFLSCWLLQSGVKPSTFSPSPLFQVLQQSAGGGGERGKGVFFVCHNVHPCRGWEEKVKSQTNCNSGSYTQQDRGVPFFSTELVLCSFIMQGRCFKMGQTKYARIESFSCPSQQNPAFLRLRPSWWEEWDCKKNIWIVSTLLFWFLLFPSYCMAYSSFSFFPFQLLFGRISKPWASPAVPKKVVQIFLTFQHS